MGYEGAAFFIILLVISAVVGLWLQRHENNLKL